jgi:folate-dependent phosphoribosylglycinamide formyltransferase PurN
MNIFAQSVPSIINIHPNLQPVADSLSTTEEMDL